MMDDGFMNVKMHSDNKVIRSNGVNNDGLGEQRERDNVCENEKSFLKIHDFRPK